MIVILDTSVLIDLLNGRRQRMTFVRNLLEQGHRLASCAVTVAEVYAGMLPGEAEATGGLLSGLEYFATSQSTAQRAGRLKASWAKKGHTLGLPDVLIAAVALEHGLTLATDNRKHFPMPELKILPLPALH
jgi:predicted nucleic acid-binding protein